jgi:hypothetical protein
MRQAKATINQEQHQTDDDDQQKFFNVLQNQLLQLVLVQADFGFLHFWLTPWRVVLPLDGSNC